MSDDDLVFYDTTGELIYPDLLDGYPHFGVDVMVFPSLMRWFNFDRTRWPPELENIAFYNFPDNWQTLAKNGKISVLLPYLGSFFRVTYNLIGYEKK